MIAKTITTFPSLTEGILLKRYKRFLADVELESGEVVTAHCANTGPMAGVLHPGGLVRLSFCPSPSRKLSWSWEQALVSSQKGDCWVGVNTSLANKLIALSVEAGLFDKRLGLIKEIKREVVYGIEKKSRIDLLLNPKKSNLDQRKIFVEVKNTTWSKVDKALFPDTITKRGQKHLKEMINELPASRAVLVPCISRNDMKVFAPADSADSEYADLFRLAVKEGVEILPCSFGFFRDHITWEGILPFELSEFCSNYNS